MGYYFSVWGIVTLFTVVMSLLVVWIFITPARVAQWSAKIPEFSVTIQDGILTETGLTEDPFIFEDNQGFIVFISKNVTEIPEDKKRLNGIYILKNRLIILQDETIPKTYFTENENLQFNKSSLDSARTDTKEIIDLSIFFASLLDYQSYMVLSSINAREIPNEKQEVIYTDVPELKNLQFNKSILSRDIMSELPSIKRIASMLIIFMVFFIHIMVAVWYCAWSFFWGLVVWLFSRGQKNPFTYEQAVGFVLSVFFPVSIVSILLMALGVWFPFSMTVLFLLTLGYNHLSYHSLEKVD